MIKKSFINRLFHAAMIALSCFGPVHASEVPPLADEPSLLERYSTGAQDLILKGFELIGINYLSLIHI